MSFSVELWGGYDFIHSTYQSHRLGLRDFIYMLNKKLEYEVEYAKGMKKIHELNYAVTKMPSLLQGIVTFKNDLFNQYEYSMEFVSSIRAEVIEPLEEFLVDQNNAGKMLNNETRKIEKEFKTCADKLEKLRSKFHSAAKQAEEAKIQCEMAKVNINVSQENKIRIETKAQNFLKEAKDSERSYLNYINTANNTRENYIETMKKMMNEFQKLEEALIDKVKDGLRKYVIYQVALLRNIQYDVDKKAAVMENINIKSDIRNYIEKNSTNILPPYKFEFIPYVSNGEDNKSSSNILKTPKEIISNVRNFISNVFYTEQPENEIDTMDQKVFYEIDSIVKYAWEGNTLPEDEKIILVKFLKEKRYRKQFLSCLNKFRISGMFTLENKSFYSIGELLLLSLDDIYTEKDYNSAKNIMNLSQTLYKTATEPNKPRMFLQNQIEKHPMWGSVDFWQEFINYNVNEELYNQKNYNVFTFESNEEKQKRVKSIIVSQLVSYSYNMISFNLSKVKVIEVIEYFSIYHDLDETKTEEIKKNFEEFSIIMEDKNKESEIEIPKESDSKSIVTTEPNENNNN